MKRQQYRARIEGKQFQKKELSSSRLSFLFSQKPCKATCLGCKGRSQAQRLSREDHRG
jgi:hypothetical protein